MHHAPLIIRIHRLCVIVLLTVFAMDCSGNSGSLHNEILSMSPIGYWPIDEGHGKYLEDISGAGTRISIEGARWDGDFLRFDGYNDWLQIPSIPALGGDMFTVSFWLFSETDYAAPGIYLFSNSFPNSRYTLKTFEEDKPLLPFGTPSDGFGISLSEGAFLAEFDNNADLFEMKSEALYQPNSWQHVLLCYGNRSVSLYLDGSRVATAQDVDYVPTEMPFIMGIQADLAPVNQWWNLSLKGTFRDLAIFDRALSPQEIKAISQTQPPPFTTLAASDASQYTMVALGDRRHASGAPKVTLSISAAIDQLKSDDEAQQVDAVRQLALRDVAASEALVPLSEMLEELYESGRSSGVLRSEDALRNALIWALEAIGSDQVEIRQLLSKAYAKPYLDFVDLSDVKFSEIRSLNESGSSYEALERYRQLPLEETMEVTRLGELSYPGKVNMKGDHIYSPILHYGDNTYIAGVEWLSNEETQQVREKYPEWALPEKPMLVRTKLTRIDKGGNQETITLEGEDFIFIGNDAKVWGWSLGVDANGYFHLVGGMHNVVQAGRFAPGTLEAMGVSRNYEDPNYPTMMYWVSEKPGDMNSFKFVGQRENPHNLPVHMGLNYMPFINDRDGRLYTYGRIYSHGAQGIGAYRYDATNQTWKALGGIPSDMMTEDPVWANHQIMTADVEVMRSLRLEADSPQAMALVWDKGTSWYNFSRGMIRFDKLNRMHLAFPIRAIEPGGEMKSWAIYAYSDDFGDTFHRADGSLIEELPLGAGEGTRQADVVGESEPVRLYFDGQGIPAVMAAGGKNYYWHTGKGDWETFSLPLHGIINAFTDSSGIMTVRNEGGSLFYRVAAHGAQGKSHSTKGHLPNIPKQRAYENNVSWQNVYDTGEWFSVQTHTQDRNHHPELYEFEFKVD